MVRTLIQLTAIIFSFEAAWFLLQGNLGLTAKDIAEVSSTKYGYNSNIVKSLSEQKADNWIGTTTARILSSDCKLALGDEMDRPCHQQERNDPGFHSKSHYFHSLSFFISNNGQHDI